MSTSDFISRQSVAKSIPREPLLQGGVATSELLRWEVVLAHNLNSFDRRRQDFWWLEVLSDTPSAAKEVAWEWVHHNPDKNFECTDWVRPASEHISFVQIEDDPHPLPVQWHVPLPEGWPLSSPVRHPVTGLRIGFRDPRSTENLKIYPSLEGRFALLRHLPASSADLLCLVPLVQDLSR